jgi:hypothetical protein
VFRRGDLAITNFRDFGELACALVFLLLNFELLDLLLEFADFSDRFLFRLPTGLPALESSFNFASSFDLVAPLFECASFLSTETAAQSPFAGCGARSSISTGRESICMRRLAADSSIKSIVCPAENGRKCSDATKLRPPKLQRH